MMSQPTTDNLNHEVEPADISAFLASDDVIETEHSDIDLGGKTVRFWFRKCTRSEAIRLAKLVEDGKLLEFDRLLLDMLSVEPTRISHADVKRWQARKGSQAALGQLVNDVMERSGFTMTGGEQTERFLE
jgi:hypothetical protein